MKKTVTKILLIALACGLGSCASVPNTLFVPLEWDNEFVAHWTSKAEERGLTLGRLVETESTVQSETDVVDAVKKAQKKVFGGSIGNLSINQFRKVGRSYIVCISDGRGVCYFLAKLGEAGVMYYPIGTIAR